MYKRTLFSLLRFSIVLMFFSCQENRKVQVEIATVKTLYNNQCARCHIAPDIKDLTKNIWKDNILPDMGARMGLAIPNYDPYKGYLYEEKIAMIKTNTYPATPVISIEEWEKITDYVISQAPDSLPPSKKPENIDANLKQFNVQRIILDEEPGSLTIYLEYLPEQNLLAVGDIQNRLRMFDFNSNKISRTILGSSPVVGYSEVNGKEYLTQMGKLNPSEISRGEFTILQNDSLINFPLELHRPVYTSCEDLDGDGTLEFIVSEFGHFTGKISLLKVVGDSLQNTTFLDQPGTIRTVMRDMNNDGKKDIVALTSQGDESITILYQDCPLQFNAERAIRFNPVYGTSWFELMDYDNDGDIDIATVHGDNADKSQILKPYHGLRIHLNDGNNNFTETYFYPLDGATRVLARDFDEDGDTDFALIATFPDFEETPMRSFVYLENQNAKDYKFLSSTFEDVDKGRWFLMDAGDVDQDGDIDIILSSFSYSFNPIPKEIQQKWLDNDIDMILLENKGTSIAN
ncbi:Repeat domain-containing protein [Flavobacteriaceae bacterium MAR_2010_188]|nr:Repeat domain-containing protein [Flavobacteriaceae bacterium MAR_2010_188]